MPKLTASEKIVLAKYTLMKEVPFFGHLTYYLTPQPTKTITEVKNGIKVTRELPSGATDGDKLYYNPEWIDSLTTEQTAYFVAHEVLHCALEHISQERIGNRKLKKWGLACDYVVNGIIDAQRSKHLSPPPGLLRDDQYNGWAVERIYGALGKILDEEFDIHIARSGDELEKLKSEWRCRIVQAYNTAKQQGHEPAGFSEFINQLVNPKIPWREALRRFVDKLAKDDYSFLRPNRKTAYLNIYMPSFLSLAIGTIVVVIDTSGSISNDDLIQFISELNAIYQTYSMTLHVIQCDAEIGSHIVLEPMQELLVENFKIIGRGGTSFVPPFELVEKEHIQPSALIYLTDGYGTFPEEPAFPVLWVSNNDRAQYPWGVVTCLD